VLRAVELLPISTATTALKTNQTEQANHCMWHKIAASSASW